VRSIDRFVAGINPALPTVDPMNLQNPIHPLPEVNIAYRHHPPETLPPPAILFPFHQTILNPLLDVSGAADQRYPRWLIEGFQCPDNRQQIETLTPQVWFDIGSLDLGRSIERSQNEPPASKSFLSARFRLQQIVWYWLIHRGFFDNTMGNIHKAAQTEKMV
jgi:hypothetical protein